MDLIPKLGVAHKNIIKRYLILLGVGNVELI